MGVVRVIVRSRPITEKSSEGRGRNDFAGDPETDLERAPIRNARRVEWWRPSYAFFMGRRHRGLGHDDRSRIDG